MVDPQDPSVTNKPPDPNLAVMPGTAPASGTPAADQKSPLDLLEDILGDPKADAAASPEGGAAPPDIPPGPSLEEIAAMEAQQAQLDQVAAQAKLDEIHAEVESSQHQTQVQQDQATHQADEAKASEQAGFAINQVGHTKI